MNEKFCILIQISLKFVPKGLIYNKAALVQVMAWHQIGNKLETMLAQCTDAYIFSTRGNWVNSSRPRQNGRHFADDTFKCIFLNGNVWIPIKISLKFVPKGRINNISALVQIMAWRRPGDKPLSEPMMVSLTTHICVTRPQWVNIMMRKGGFINIYCLCHFLILLRYINKMKGKTQPFFIILKFDSIYLTFIIMHLLTQESMHWKLSGVNPSATETIYSGRAGILPWLLMTSGLFY